MAMTIAEMSAVAGLPQWPDGSISSAGELGQIAGVFYYLGATPTGDITITVLAEPLTGHATRAAQADTRPVVTHIADTRPQYRFIH